MPRHGHMGPQGADEKAKDLKGTLKKLLHYMSVFKVQMLLIVIFAVCGTTFTIIGPKILGKATTEIANGLMSKVSGGSGMDFEKIGQILLLTLALYLVSTLCSFIQGYLMTGVSQKTTYRLRKEISEKINRMPMNYFDTKPVGEVLSRVTNDVDTLGQSLNQSATQMIQSVTTLIGVHHDAYDQSFDDTCDTDYSPDFHAADRICHEAFSEIFPRTAGVSGKCEWTGGRSLQWSQYYQGF